MVAYTESLVTRLELDASQHAQQLDNAHDLIRRYETRAVSANRRAATAFRSPLAAIGSLRSAIAGLTAALGVRQAIQYAEAFTGIQNALRATGVATEDLGQVTGELFDVANRTRAPIEAISQLYQRASLAAGELGISQQELLDFVETTGQALAVQGTSAAAASGALLQLSQALGSGIVRAEEFNSLLEGALPIAQAAARGIDRAGGSVARLRQLIAAGEITSREFFEGIRAGTPEIAEAFARTEVTVGQAMTNLRNATIEAVGLLDQATAGTSSVAGAINDLANAIGEADIQSFAAAIGATVALAQEANEEFENWFATLAGGVPTLDSTRRELERITDFIMRDVLGMTAAPDTSLEALAPPAVVERIRQMREEMRRAGDEAARLGSGGAALSEDFEEAQDAIRRETEELGLRIAARGVETEELRIQLQLLELRSELSADAVDKLEDQVRLMEELRTELALTPQPFVPVPGPSREEVLAPEAARIRTEVRTPTESFDLARRQIDDLREAGLITAEEHSRALGQLQGKLTEASQSYQILAESADIFARTASAGITDAIFAGESLSDTFADITQSIAAAVTQALIFQSITSAIGSPTGSPTGGASGIYALFSGFGGGGGISASGTTSGFTTPGGQFVPTLQHGGRLLRGQLGVVGEAGPEFFVPDTSGMIVPAGRGGGTGAHIVINNNVAGAGVTARQDPQTGRVDIAFDQLVAQQFRPGTATSRAMRDRFNLNFSTQRR